MAHRLDKTPTYLYSADFLGPLAKLQLRFAEQSIRSRGDRLTNTIQVWMGKRTVTLYQFGDLSIYLEIRAPKVVTLYLVVDAHSLPDWFVYPTGDWFEDVDFN
jgi:hypothetical protein